MRKSLKRKNRWKRGVRILLCVLFLTGCRGEDEALGDSRLYDEMSGEGEGDIIIGFSEIGSESDWRRAHTESFKSTFSSENGYYLLFEDAQQKQENQLKAIRNFILQEVDYIVLDPIVETG